jgi:hypothetical protein
MSKVRGQTSKTPTHMAPTFLEHCARFPKQDAIAIWALYPHVYASATREVLPQLLDSGWEETGVEGVVSIHATDEGYVEKYEVAERLVRACVAGRLRQV